MKCDQYSVPEHYKPCSTWRHKSCRRSRGREWGWRTRQRGRWGRNTRRRTGGLHCRCEDHSYWHCTAVHVWPTRANMCSSPDQRPPLSLVQNPPDTELWLVEPHYAGAKLYAITTHLKPYYTSWFCYIILCRWIERIKIRIKISLLWEIFLALSFVSIIIGLGEPVTSEYLTWNAPLWPGPPPQNWSGLLCIANNNRSCTADWRVFCYDE